jgi:hypothetical protein
MADSDLDLVCVGSESDRHEGSAKEITEADFNAALRVRSRMLRTSDHPQKELVACRKEETRNHLNMLTTKSWLRLRLWLVMVPHC